MKEIVFAGGCFWGVEAYFKRIPGVLKTAVGYANGRGKNPSYQDVCAGDRGFAEAVKLTYDEKVVSLKSLLAHLFRIIDPTSLNKQGNDRGIQYRTGVYFTRQEDRDLAKEALDRLQDKYERPLQVENKPLENFYLAEEVHQDYLGKNPLGYCHVDLSLADKPLEEDLDLDPLSYYVMKEQGTERPFSSPYYKVQKPGIFVDKISGKPLFVTSNQYEPGCGWPSFTRPIDEEDLDYVKDLSHGMVRKEVRSKSSDSHLGHVFTDGPKDQGGLRYCMNGAAFTYIPKEEMEEKGYGDYLYLLEDGEEDA